MKVTRLIFTFLLAATAWTESVDPLVFFAKVGTDLVPLSDTLYDIEAVKVSVLCYGSSITPVEFTLQSNYIITENTSTPGYAGFYEDGFVFGPRISPNSFKFDDDMKVQNYPLYSCRINLSNVRIITYKKTNPSCFDVDIYLLHYDRTTRSVARYVNVPMQDSTYALQSDENIVSGKHLPEFDGNHASDKYGKYEQKMDKERALAPGEKHVLLILEEPKFEERLPQKHWNYSPNSKGALQSDSYVGPTTESNGNHGNKENSKYEPKIDKERALAPGERHPLIILEEPKLEERLPQKY